MSQVDNFPFGTFAWVDAITTDADGGIQFYTELMGWDYQDLPIGDGAVYTMFNKNGHDVAGFRQMPIEMMELGMESAWRSYVLVQDLDPIPAKVRELGGTVVMEPIDVFDSGRMMVLQDPNGATLSLWQATNYFGAGLVNEPGSLCWNELGIDNPEVVKEFFSELLGWQYRKVDGYDYHNILNQGRLNGGILKWPDEWGEVPANWMVYFAVADIDAAVKKTAELGGSIRVAISEAPGIGRFAIIADPQGAICTLIQLNDEVNWG